MTPFPAALLLLAVAGLQLVVTRPAAFRDEQWKFPRVRTAAREKDQVLKQLFAGKRLKYPPGKILLRAFKKEGTLEVWVGNSPGAPYSLIKSYSICATSGIPGPKRRFGDEQVPEGFYDLDWFNPQSNFYLSLQVSYPNAADRLLGFRQNPGGDIFLHGNCVTIGCIPITDEGIRKCTGSQCWPEHPDGIGDRRERNCPICAIFGALGASASGRLR